MTISEVRKMSGMTLGNSHPMERMAMHGVDDAAPKKVAENMTPEWMHNRLRYLDDVATSAGIKGRSDFMARHRDVKMHIKTMRARGIEPASDIANVYDSMD